MLRKLVFAIVPALILWSAPVAHSQTLAFSVSSGGDDQLYQINLMTGTESLVGPTGFADVAALAFHPISGVLYGIDEATDTLVTISTTTGAGTAVGAGAGNLGVAVQGVGLTFDSLGNLWMSADSSTTLYSVDAATGVATAVGPMGQAVTGLAAAGTTVYGLGGDGTDNFVTVNTATGAATPVGGLVNLLSVSDGGLAIEPNGTLWMISDPAGEVGSVNPATGEATWSSLVISGRYESLAIAPPTSAASLCGAAPVTGCRRPVAEGNGNSAFTMSAKGNNANWQWKWTAGATTVAADFGNPLTGTSYALCVYDHVTDTPVLVMSAFAPPGAGWSTKKGRTNYKNKAPLANGMSHVSLNPGTARKARILARMKGKNMPMPPMPMTEDSMVKVQLLSLHGVCWEAEYSAPASTNTVRRYSGSGM